MSIHNLQESIRKAQKRLGSVGGVSARKRRSDRGRMRLPDDLSRFLGAVLSGQERPAMRAVLSDLNTYCAGRGLRCPSRATVYKFMATASVRSYDIGALPAHVRSALYNLSAQGSVPGHQLVFCCFNYGELGACSFAAGLPWLDLYQALRMRGFRPQSRGLLEAAARVRGI